MPEKVTDPAILAQLNGGPVPVTDPIILAQLNGEPVSTLDKVKDAYKSLGTGVVKGALNAAGDVGEAVMGPFGPSHHFGNLMADLGLRERPAPELSYGERLQSKVPTYAPQTTPGQYAERAGEFVGNPLSYVGGAATLPGKAAVAGLSGLGSKAGEELGTNLGFPKTGSFLGAALGGATPNIARRAITPFPASVQRARDVAAVEAEGVPLTAGDRTGNRMLRATESELGQGVNERQRDAFTQAAFNRVGEHIGDRPITGQGGVVDTMLTRTGGHFDALTARNHADMDRQLITDLRDVHDTYNGIPGLYSHETVNSVNGSINRVLDAMQHSGSLNGQEYQTLRSNLRAAAQGASDPQRASALHDVTNALDDAMERTIARTNPQDAGAFAQARRDYRNALVLERWAGSANMTPATLAQAAKAIYGKRAYVRGQDDFSDMAESGRRVLAQYPDSGTASRQNIEKALSRIGGAATHALSATIGYGAGHHFGQDVEGLLLGEAVGPFVARPAARAALMNPATQGYLGNQILPHGYAEPISVRLARALAQTQGGQ